MKSHLKAYFGEYFGTLLLVLLGDAVIAQVLLSDHLYGDWLSINLAWASGLLLSAYVSDPSPAVNPSITLALCIFRNKKGNTLQKSSLKILAQFLGAFVAATLVFAVYAESIAHYEHGTKTIPGGTILSGQEGHQTAGIFATYPASYLSMGSAFVTEFIGSLVLMFGVLAIGDSAAPNIVPVANFFLLLAIGTSLGFQTGYALNPARDFAPRLLSFIVGYGSEVFTVGPWYFLIPLLAPTAGCLVGAFIYDMTLYDGEDSPDWLQNLRVKLGIDQSRGIQLD